VAVLLLFGTSLAAVQPAISAGPTSGGSVQPIAPPASVADSALESNSFVRFFNEKTAFLLNQNVSADITQPGTVGNSVDLTPGIISANQLIDTYLLHADPVGPGNPAVTYAGTVTFELPILGLLVQTNSLNVTDGVLGSPSTIYTPAGSRGFEWPSSLAVGDIVQLSADFRTITFVLKATSQYDQIRVITTGVPEPSAIALAAFCLVLASTAWRRRGS
jgi:hypothetical protein